MGSLELTSTSRRLRQQGQRPLPFPRAVAGRQGGIVQDHVRLPKLFGQTLVAVDPLAKSLTFWGLVENPLISQKVEVYRSNPIAVRKQGGQSGAWAPGK